MNYHIDIQHATPTPNPVSDQLICDWACTTLAKCCKTAEITIRFVTSEEMLELNSMYRNQSKTTNVLAFPSDLPTDIELDYPLLGDVVICPEVLAHEANVLNSDLTAHWAHIIIHGVLHLLGYDHIETDDATIMQALEIDLLAQYNFANPYITLEEKN